METKDINKIAWIILAIGILLMIMLPTELYTITNYIVGLSGGLFLSVILRGDN